MSRYTVIKDNNCWNIVNTQTRESDVPDSQNSIKLMTVYDYADVVRVLDWLNQEPSGISILAAEREDQIAKGYDAAHDDIHTKGQIADAAFYYLIAATYFLEHPDKVGQKLSLPPAWPWEAEAWKPGTEPVSNLVKAGALIAAEIERLIRAKASLASTGA